MMSRREKWTMLAMMVASSALKLPIAAFFAFVGWHKAFATISDLEKYGSWTIHIPEPLGRCVGWSEMACALLLIVPGRVLARRWRESACILLIANQMIAAAVHATHGEVSALWQNGALIALLFFIFWTSRKLDRFHTANLKERV